VSGRLLVLGLSYTVRRFVALHGRRFARIDGTSRRPDAAPGVTQHLFDGVVASDELRAAARGATHVLASIPPGEAGDPGLAALGEDLAAAPDLGWIGYLSTTAVYGDRGGAWVGEATPPAPTSPRGRRRLAAEAAWQHFGRVHAVPVQVFRLAGIYGPGRNALIDVARGTARRIHKAGQCFNRVHVDDIAAALAAAMARPGAGPLFNLADDEPAPSEEVVRYAAELLGVAPPPLVPFEGSGLSAMARSFWAENKRVSSRATRQALGFDLAYPTYRAGLAALHAVGGKETRARLIR
jgi:nucleoside-diphosphate-sugar epimerase